LFPLGLEYDGESGQFKVTIEGQWLSYFEHLTLFRIDGLDVFIRWSSIIPGLFTYHRVNQLDTVVLRGVMAGSHHNTDPLPTKLLRTEASKETHSENDGVEEITASRFRSASFDVNKRTIAGGLLCGGGVDRS
jgi:hypothetical protein